MMLLRKIIITEVILMLLFISINEATKKDEEQKEEEEGISFLSELPLQELLASRENLPKELQEQQSPMALPLMDVLKPKMTGFKGLHKVPIRKTFFEEDYDEDKEWVHKKPEKHHGHDILNTSLTVLSYLAFGGYLLCMIVNSLRQNNKSLMAAYPSMPGIMAPPSSMTALLQQYGTQRPIRIKFPAVTIHQGKKKRRKRAAPSHQTGNSTEESAADIFSYINAIDYVEMLSSQISGVGDN